MITATHRYEIMTMEMRPQDDSTDGRDLTFKTMEHGGEYPDSMPQVIRVTDKEGRWCNYEPTTINGQVVRYHSYEFHDEKSPEDAA